MRTLAQLRILIGTVIVLLATGFIQSSLAASAANGKKVLLVGDLNIKPQLRIVDEHIKQHLQSMGFVVTMADQDAPISAADGANLIVVSSSVSAQFVEARFRDIRVPVVTWESYIIYHMRMTGKVKYVDYSAEEKGELNYLWMVNAPHPIAAGISNGLFKPYKAPLPKHQVNWGRPGPGATIIATLPGEPRKSPLFCYEKGAMMDADFPAPARRVMLFLHTDTFDELTDQGIKVFDAAILWALANPPD